MASETLAEVIATPAHAQRRERTAYPINDTMRRRTARASITLAAGGPGVTVGIVAAGALVGTVAFLLAVGAGRALPATAVHVVVGLSFITAGAIARHRRPANRVGALMCSVGFVWFAFDLYWVSNPLTYTVNRLTRDLYLPLLAHLFLAFPGGRLRSRFDRVVIAATYVLFAAGTIAARLFSDPGNEGCSSCPRNLLLVRSDPRLHAIIAGVDHVLVAALALLVFGLVLWHWQTATPAQRRALDPAIWASGPVLLLVVSTQILYTAGWSTLGPLGAVGPLALLALPLAFLVGLLRSQLGYSGLGGLVIELGNAPPPDELRDALARTLHDPSVELAYRLPDGAAYVDADGRAVTLPAAGSGRATTLIERDGAPIAALIHDASLGDEPELVEAVAAAARLAVENERLQAAVRAQLEDVRASRARLVTAQDAERRRVERDLHDGAQQQLVTLALMLRTARERLATHPDGELEATLAAASAQLAEALAELRDLARGIHPAILTEAGLAPALESLAERAPTPTVVQIATSARLPEAVEASIYFVVSEALANVAQHACATSVEVRVSLDAGRARVEVSDDGIGGADADRGTGLRGLADRVAALQGRLLVESPPRKGTRVVAEIPCG
jgi:signal transduction histidine kinase